MPSFTDIITGRGISNLLELAKDVSHKYIYIKIWINNPAKISYR